MSLHQHLHKNNRPSHILRDKYVQQDNPNKSSQKKGLFGSVISKRYSDYENDVITPGKVPFCLFT